MLRNMQCCAADPGAMLCGEVGPPMRNCASEFCGAALHAAPRPGHERSGYARVPVNGKLPIGPMPISPDMLSPETFPVKARVSGIGLVTDIFQATSSPLVVPSKISVELPSAPC